VRSFDKFFRSAAFPLVIIAVLVVLAVSALRSKPPKTVALTWSEFAHAIRTDAGGFSNAGVSEDRDHQSLSATINGRKVKVDYPAQESLVRLEHLMAAHGIAYAPRRTGRPAWFTFLTAVTAVAVVVSLIRQVRARRRPPAAAA